MDIAIDTVGATSIEAVYRAHGGRLWRSVLAYSGDRDIASDSVAEAFAQALGRGGAIREPLPWLWKAAFRIAAGALKERGRRTSRLPEESYDLPDGPSSVVLALGQLPERQRAAVVLHYYVDLPVGDVARVLGTTTPAVKMDLMRARRRLRTALEVDHA